MRNAATFASVWTCSGSRLGRTVLVALGTLAICSCQAPSPQTAAHRACPPPGAVQASGGMGQDLPAEAYLGGPAVPPGPPGMELGVPLPYQAVGPWAPPGIAQPWPRDEYVRDGGVTGPGVAVGPDWQVRGLGMEDAVAHYDTLDGQTVVEPTNRVYVYSPRFGAVRQVVSLVESQQANGSCDLHQPTQLVLHGDVQRANQGTQDYQARRDVGTNVAVIYRSRQGDGAISTVLGAKGFQNAFRAYEDLSVIRSGTFVESEMATLAQSVSAAVAWSHDQAVQVILDNKAALAETGTRKLEEIYTSKKPPSNPKLRVVKVASTQTAQPGDMVAFTIRFDNVGNEAIGNVTILDNLSTRLEYLPETAQSSLAAKFLTHPNESGSLILRWEITSPLTPGQGGIVRFTCRVR